MPFVVAALSGILAFVAFPFHVVDGAPGDPAAWWALPPLILVAYVPLFWALHREARGRRRFLLGWVTGFVHLLGMQRWIGGTLVAMSHFPEWAGAISVVVYALWAGLPWALIAYAAPLAEQRLGRGPGLLAACAGIALLERHAPVLFPFHTSCAFFTYPSLLQAAELIGVAGISAFIWGLNMALARLLAEPRRPGRAYVVDAGAMLAAVIVLGLVRPGAPVGERTLDVLLVQPNVTTDQKNASDPRVREGVYRDTVVQTRAALADGAPDLVIWPEGGFPFSYTPESYTAESYTGDSHTAVLTTAGTHTAVLTTAGTHTAASPTADAAAPGSDDGDTSPDSAAGKHNKRPLPAPKTRAEKYSRALRQFAERLGVPLITGSISTVEHGGEVRDTNSVFYFAAGGAPPMRYDKRVLLLFGESVPFADWFPSLRTAVPGMSHHLAGLAPATWVVGDVRLAITLCYEAIFADFARDALDAEDAHVLVNLTNDVWFGHTVAAAQHLMVQWPRAVESRRWLVRATNSGISAFVSPAGELLGMTPLSASATTRRRIDVSEPVPTVYDRVGDWPLLLVGLLALGWGLARRRQSTRLQGGA